MFEFLRNSSTKKIVSTAVSLVFLLGQQPYALYASGVSTVYTDDSAKLVVDCTEITTEDAQDKGGKMGDFVKESTLGCEKSLATVSVATKADSGTVSAGLFLLGTDGADAFGKNSSTSYEMSSKDVTVTGLPKVTAVKSKTGVGAELAIREVKIRHSRMATETTGTYTFGAYAYVSALVPTDGGVGYDDIESVELDWSGVSATGTYKFTDPSTNEVVTRTFTFTGNGTSTISGEDLTFTTKTNTTTGHCAKTASDDYVCVYADGVKKILKLAEVENVDGTLSCAGVKDFVDKNPDMKDRFVCKKGEEVIDCSDIELDQEEAVCKNDVQQIVDCTEVINKNACYKSGKVAEDYGYTCWRSGAQISCTDLGLDGTCPTVCKINDEEVSCDEVRNKNACVDYNIYTEKLGYTCEVGGKSVSCVTLGKGTCDLEVTCLYGEEEISCDRYKNAMKCSEQYSFDISPRYWCKRGNVQVSCESLTAATSCDLSPVVCKDKNDASEISCDIIKNYNECSKYGETADDFMQYGCQFDEITVDCSILPPDASSACPLPKECDLVESLGYNKKLECSAMEDALKCQADGWGNYYQYYTCKIGRTEIDCNTNVTLGTCDLNICKDQCEYLGVSLDGKEDTCQCLPAPICDGDPSAQTGTTKCTYGGTPKGQGSQDCVCKAQPNCKELCTYGGVAKADGTPECSCYEEPICSGTISSQTGSNKCTYGGTPKADGTQACACNEAPDCTAVCPYGGTAKADGTTECSCNTEPVCSGALSNQTGSNKCTYGGTPSADGSMSCTCNEAPNCALTCPYGGSPKANGSQDCSCNAAPVCSGAIASQTGTNTCTYGGSPSGDGTQSCVCNEAPDCATLCTYGGSPKANGLNGCNCVVPKNCSDASICAYGGTNNSDGSCSCYSAPNCTLANICPYGGTAKANGTQSCSCNSAPVCSGTISSQTGTNKCTYGGTATANGTMACTCDTEPDCSIKCDYGGTANADGTQDCTCTGAPVCLGELSTQTGTNKCVYGGKAAGGGTYACYCNDEPDCTALCDFGGTVIGNGYPGCQCYEEPDCNTTSHCPYGGYPEIKSSDAAYVCTEATCPYGYLTDDNPNKCDASICPYGSSSGGGSSSSSSTSGSTSGGSSSSWNRGHTGGSSK